MAASFRFKKCFAINCTLFGFFRAEPRNKKLSLTFQKNLTGVGTRPHFFALMCCVEWVSAMNIEWATHSCSLWLSLSLSQSFFISLSLSMALYPVSFLYLFLTLSFALTLFLCVCLCVCVCIYICVPLSLYDSCILSYAPFLPPSFFLSTSLFLSSYISLTVPIFSFPSLTVSIFAYSLSF